MAPVLELDRQTASFVRQLEEQRKLEKSLLVERVRGTKEGLESVFGDIKSRVEMLEKLNGSASASCRAAARRVAGVDKSIRLRSRVAHALNL